MICWTELRWPELVSATPAATSRILVATAMLLTVSAWQRRELAPPWRTHFGLLLAGWGAFNLVEGLLDHQLLGIHHVRDDLGTSIRASQPFSSNPPDRPISPTGGVHAGT